MIDVRMFTVGQVQENCFIVRRKDAANAVIVDPGDEAPKLLAAVDSLGIETVEAILITHTHFDHVGAVAPVAEATNAPVYVPELEKEVLANIMDYVPWPGFGPFESYDAEHTVGGGETLELAGLTFDVVFTPGHSPGHVTYAIAGEDAVFSGDITLDGRKFSGDPLGYGLQGHNCGYRHRDFWVWMHAFFSRNCGPPSTLEALVYNMPFGLVFRKAVLWHDRRSYIFRSVIDSGVNREEVLWNFRAEGSGLGVSAAVNGNGLSLHRLPYTKTNCAGTFEVMNNSLASADIVVERADGDEERMRTANGAVLEVGGSYPFR